ncbi:MULTISPECIES: DUF3086 domain-containing protein [unclassified Coleofasciculus]|uniref:DUF3086 domain-containing protein n=1 Tax=unclassified Coleofasciculus TaxID=2692782 RepID=UPI00188307F1|nr:MULTISPECIES: DUF3086 domain-containing protein [unclassified Coleofasciculus]MBE9124699.1 DUF3086 domain-containing protein [Coleofasciculus sp. LEGE 07081]MBE9147026.1 DUF3086 domain-containing protein [Coleofasciculus sp. LEGE 07092]
MNSDESQIQKPEQEQQPAIEAGDEQPLEKPEAMTGMSAEPQQTEDSNRLEESHPKLAVFQPPDPEQRIAELARTIADLEHQEKELRQKIANLQTTQTQRLSDQLSQTQAAIGTMIQEGLSELEQRKQALLISVEQLERRRERIRTEMRTTFAGVSQELAIRVQGFKDYLVGSLQDLVAAAEELELSPTDESPLIVENSQPPETPTTPKFAEQAFQEQIRQIRSILDQYRKMPDYYGPPWQLRRTFEPIHAERVSTWFFTQGGRGAVRTMGSRLQNILVGSAVISVLRMLYGDRLRPLVLANTPERLGEWRRGLQDCLGISRSDFGPERGVVLFEEAAPLVQKADRLITQKQLPLIIIDETEDQISLSILQFPLWLAFAADPQQMSTYQY